MWASVAKKILSLIPLLFAISIILFLLISMLPGDAALTIVGEGSDLSSVEAARERLGLDRPIYIQYFTWLKKILSGNLGNSYISNQPVAEKLLERLPVTFELAIIALVIATLIAIPVGVFSAVRRNSLMDNVISVFSMLGIAIPPFWLGMLLILLFSVTLNWLPASGYVPFFQNPMQNLKSMIMPAFCIGVSYAASLTRQTRSAMLDVLDMDYINTARVKGLKRRIVIWKHALRNALIPVITVFAMQLGRLIGGTVVVETVFVLPGIGKSIVDGITMRDYPVVMGFVLAVAVFIVVINTIVDILYIFLDPRVSSGIQNQ